MRFFESIVGLICCYQDMEKVETRIRTASTSSDRVLQLSRRLNALKNNGCAENALLMGYLKLIDWLMEDWTEECTEVGTSAALKTRNFYLLNLLFSSAMDTIEICLQP